MAVKESRPKEMAFVAVSGICWPTKSRHYLINLVKEVALATEAKFIIVAGYTVDGKYLEAELNARRKEHLKGVGSSDREWARHQFEEEFVEEYAVQLSEFLPRVDTINWHITIAERIYDRPIGAKILEHLRELRSDVRIIGERQEDGFYDHEPKVPVQFPGFEEIRVLLPHRSPWFSKVITNLVQRLTNAFSPRTLSPKPALILAGVTGTAAHLPSYDGVPVISVPDLSKLLEQQATEHMIGATVIRVVANGRDKARIINGVHNFRTAVFLEKRVAVPSALPMVQQAVMHGLIPSNASKKGILYRVNANKERFHRQANFTPHVVQKALQKLVEANMVVFSQQSNQYGINENLRRNAAITLESLYEGSRAIKHVVWSCFHGGALKTLYFTALDDIPRLAMDADAIIENGDLIQGIAHQYEYNGELLPMANGVDKQEIINAYDRATKLLAIFSGRLQNMRATEKDNTEVALQQCLIPYVYNAGNHDKWGSHNKAALILQLFYEKLHILMVEGVLRICQELNMAVTFDQVKRAVDASIIRVGESRMVELNGITLGIKHPHKGRTIQKSARIQEVADFIWRRFDSYVGTVAKKSKGFSIAYVANFHEAAAAHITKFGQTVLGVMTGAYLKDTEFENHNDKVVEYGPAVVTARFDKEGRLLYSETEFMTGINEEDRVFVTADRLDSKQVLSRCIKLLDRIGLAMPWR